MVQLTCHKSRKRYTYTYMAKTGTSTPKHMKHRYMYRSYHDVEVSMGFIQLRTEDSVNPVPTEHQVVEPTCTMALGYRKRTKLILIGQFTYLPPRRWV